MQEHAPANQACWKPDWINPDPAVQQLPIWIGIWCTSGQLETWSYLPMPTWAGLLNSTSEVGKMRPTFHLHARARPVSIGTRVALPTILLARDASYNLPASRRGHSKVNAFNTQKQEVIIIRCVPRYDRHIMNSLVWSTALTCTFGSISDIQVDTRMVFSFYCSVSRVLWVKGGNRWGKHIWALLKNMSQK